MIYVIGKREVRGGRGGGGGGGCFPACPGEGGFFFFRGGGGRETTGLVKTPKQTQAGKKKETKARAKRTLSSPLAV